MSVINLRLISAIQPSFARGRRFQPCAVAAVLAVLGIAASAQAQSSVDGFNPGVNGPVSVVLVQPDGKVLIGGAFTMLGGGGTGTTPRSYIGRLNLDGSLDSSFNPGANGEVTALALQSDGKILVGGQFTTLGGGGTGTSVRNCIGRLNADGSLDSGFDPGANDRILALAVQPDGRIVAGGKFTTLGGGGTGSSTRNRVGRLNADGTLDAAFDPGANGDVLAVLVQPNLRILIGGAFTSLGGGGTGTTSRNHVGRLGADGSLDASFNPGANANVATVAVQADGRIVIGGLFTTLGGGGTGTTSRQFLGRLGADGSLDSSFDPGADGGVSVVSVQADGRVLVGGSFASLGGGGSGTTPRHHVGRVNFDGSLDSSFDPGVDADVLSLVVQSDGQIILGGTFTTLGGGGTGTTTRNRLARIDSGGWLDADFNPGADGGFVEALALQADGRILVGGNFTTLGGGGTVPRSHIGRLNPDGSLDASFNPGTNSQVNALVVQPDGKIILGGDFFTTVSGSTRNAIARLQADGSIDTGFDPGANGFINALAVQPDGKILVGGDFSVLGGGGFGNTPRNNLGRLNPDGSIDIGFDPNANGLVHALAVQPDGKILIGGAFTTLGGLETGVVRNRIARLNADGSVDGGFDPGANGPVSSLALQADGAILLGGDFTTLGGGGTGTTTRNRIGRLQADGALDASFNPGASDGVYTVSTQADGKILVGGSFTMLGGGTGTTPRSRIGRLNVDGSVDSSFNPGAGQRVDALVVLADGKILVGGAFTGLGGAPRNFIGRLTNTESAVQRLDVTGGGSVVTWSRSGAQPEIGRVTLEVSTDAETFAPLGSASRTAGGWILSNQSLSAQQNLFIRARGYYAPAQAGGVSGSIVESIRNAYVSCPTISTTSLAPGIAGIPYTAALNSSGAIGVVAFGVTGVLPSGVAVGAAGLSGTPLQFGSFPITLTATDTLSGCAAAPQNVTLTIGEPTIILSATTFPSGTAGIAYPATTITQSGGIGAATFAVTSGALPNGLTLSSAGAVAGTPIVFGVFNFTVTATDVNGSTGARAYAATIGEPTITLTALLPTGTAGVDYATTISQTGGIGTATFALTTGALPSGLALSGAGALSGTPIVFGTFNFTVTATDVNGSTGSRAYALTIAEPTITLSSTTFPTGTAGVAYSTMTLTQAGGIGTATFAVTSGALPSGLALSSAGTVSGTPIVFGLFNFTVTATDVNGSTGSRAYAVTVEEPTITLSVTTLPGGMAGIAYATTTITQTGGIGTATFTLTSGALPGGLTLSSAGAVSGTPIVFGAFNFTVTATDVNGSTGSRAYAVTIAEPTITLSATTFPAGTAGIAYPATTITQTGGIGTATFAVTTGALPGGLTLSGAGAVSGTPIVFGVFNFTVTATDVNGSTGSRAYAVTIAEPTITLSATTFLAGTAGIAYPATTITQSGGIGAATFAVTSGALPGGLALSAGGVVSGTPIVFGTFNFTVRATDVNGSTGSRAYAVSVAEPTIALSATTFPAGTAGIAYPATTITQSGGIGAATFAVIAGALPNGLALASAGAVSGTPMVFGTFNFTVRATDVNGSTGSRAYAVSVAEPTITLSNTTFSTGTQDVDYPTTTITETGGIGVATFAVTSGALPTGLTLSSSGAISGKPTVAATFNFTVRATDVNGSTGSRPYVIIVQPQSAPSMTLEPASRTVAAGSTVTFLVAASGAPTPTYKWQVSADGASWADVTDSANYSGATTVRLAVATDPAALTEVQYRAVATNVAGSATSLPAALVVTAPLLSKAPDFDGDGQTDISVFRPTDGLWSIRTPGGESTYTWGGGSDRPVAADYDGDGRTDVAVYRPSSGAWYMVLSSTHIGAAYAWGGGGDVPVPADYDGDGKADIAVFRPSTGAWYILQSSNMTGKILNWGASIDTPMPRDYDGDGKADIAVFRPSTGAWYILQSSNAAGIVQEWGASIDTPVPADYDGDGKADIAVFRPSTGAWYILQSGTGFGRVLTWGATIDAPVPADYDGDGKADVAVYRPSTATWYVLQSGSGVGFVAPWGARRDLPL